MKLITKKEPPATVRWGVTSSLAGKLIVGVSDKGEVCRLSFLRKQKAADVIAEWRRDWPHTDFKAGAKLDAYQTSPVMMVGTDFQHAVWRVMAKIPAGSVTTYGEIASYIGKPNASRAVGAACGANPVPYLVPCHRVVAANGRLGGFSGGLETKKALLKGEGYL